MSKEGFENENIICNAINGKRFYELNDNLKKFLSCLFGSVSKHDIIFCEKKAGMNKSDVIISLNKKSYKISIKSGSGNSVHQETIDDFIKYLKKDFNLPNDLEKYIKLFIWGDGTINGKGLVKYRIDSREFERKYPLIINRINVFFKKNKKKLIKRFVINGLKSKYPIDYIYYGDVNKGYWSDSESILNFLIDDLNESNSVISVGRLSFQAWNRNINNTVASEKKRGVIQLKWASIGTDLKNLMEKDLHE